MSGRPRVPARTCVSCRRVRTKEELVRVARRPDGSVVVDPRGREPGRGAYVCRTAECIARAPAKMPAMLHARIADRSKLQKELTDAR